MNAKKCSYIIFTKGTRKGLEFDLQLNGESIPYNPNIPGHPIFLGITFDERVCFNTHFSNLRTRALKKLNIIKIFSHSSWHMNKKTLSNIYRSFIGSLFDYSFFTIACVSQSSLILIQRIQNRAIRSIYKLKWDSPTNELISISGILSLKTRFFQLGARYLVKSIRYNNPLLCLLLFEYMKAWSSITSGACIKTTPLCLFINLIAISLACMIVFT